MAILRRSCQPVSVEMPLFASRQGHLDLSPAIYRRVDAVESNASHKGRLSALARFNHPAGTDSLFDGYPAINRRATIHCPSGTIGP